MDVVVMLHACVRGAGPGQAGEGAHAYCLCCRRWLRVDDHCRHCRAPGGGVADPAESAGAPDAADAAGAGGPVTSAAPTAPDALAVPDVPGASGAPGSLPCPVCRGGRPAPSRPELTTRMALVSAASVAGMLGGAIGMLLLATFLGLGGELTVLCMLVAEMAAGALAGRHADRHLDTWVAARARAAAARRLPRARVHRPARRASRRLLVG